MPWVIQKGFPQQWLYLSGKRRLISLSQNLDGSWSWQRFAYSRNGILPARGTAGDIRTAKREAMQGIPLSLHCYE